MDDELPGLAQCVVTKRDGSHAAFDPRKIESALARAGAATGEFGGDEAAGLAHRLARRFAQRRAPRIGVEAIQDAVEIALLRARHLRTARAYIVYREQHARLRADRQARSSTSRPRSTSTWTSRIGGSMPMRTRGIRWAG